VLESSNALKIEFTIWKLTRNEST